MKFDSKKITELLTRGVGEFIDPEGKFKAKLVKKLKGEYKKPIIIKFGIDPTRSDIHLGHTVVFRKLRQFQELGCKIVFLIGDYTAQIGDPTGKSKVRPEVRKEEVRRNAETYVEQVKKILITEDKDLFDWISNSDWYESVTDFHPVGDSQRELSVQIKIFDKNKRKQVGIVVGANSFWAKAFIYEKTRRQITEYKKNQIVGLTVSSLLWTLKHITYMQLIQRDMFQARIKNNEELYMHEVLYPVLQGVDSGALSMIFGSCDLEVGGTDQTFNMLMGRSIMKYNKQEDPQSVLAFEILEGIDGKEKMSKSLDNYIGITESPNEIYGKIMSVPDELITKYFELTTDVSLVELEKIKKDLKSGKNPKDYKMRLGFELVKMYHSKNNAEKAQQYFVNTFSKKETPDDMPTIHPSAYGIITVLVESKLSSSKGDARRAIEQGGVKINGNKVTSYSSRVQKGNVVQKGKRFFVKVE